MKYIALALFLFLCNAAARSQGKVDALLEKVSQNLNDLKNIRYSTTRELNYSSENYFYTSTWKLYCDFQSNDKIIGFKYQVDDSLATQFFNGTESFRLDKRTRTMQVDEHPDKETFSSLSPFYNSLLTFRKILPLLLSDKTATRVLGDTMIHNAVHTMITINTGKRRIQNLGEGFDAMTTKSNIIYKIVLQKNNDLPFEIVQVNDANKDFIKTTFTGLESNSTGPPESSWYYSTYTNEYKNITGEATPQLLPKGSIAPAWTLLAVKDNRALSLSDLRGKVILLDFWIKNCKPCIQSVPHLNELQDKFRSRNVAIISVNSYDPLDDVNWFLQKYQPRYTVLLQGKEVAGKYGVSGFPAFFIIDKEGKIIYSGAGFDASMQTEMETIIKKAL